MDVRHYQEDVAAWRQTLDGSLRRENGWLALAGLFWLREGDNAFGSDPANPVVLPGEAAAQLGVFRLTADAITLYTTLGADVRINGDVVREAVLLPDSSGTPTRVTIGQVSMIVIQREAMYAIRMWDNGRSQRHTFPGRQWYSLQPNYCLTTTFTPSNAPQAMTMNRSLGADFELPTVGSVTFTLNGEEYSLLAFMEADGKLFLPFKDKTSGQETFGAGRYFKTDIPQNNTITLDFNRAYHPPCFFTPYATCTLPPRQNWLPIAIEVGERI
jgi:uncharacterized protein (DUF1684 family)